MNTIMKSVLNFGGFGRSGDSVKSAGVIKMLVKGILYAVLGFILLRYFSIAAILLLVVGAVYMTVPNLTRIVPTGHRGLVVKFGVATNKIVNEGLAIRVPFIREIMLFETRIRNYKYQFACVTHDQRRALGAMRFSYQLDLEMLQEVFAQFGADYQTVMMDSIVASVFSETLAQTDSLKLLSTYDGIKEEVAKTLYGYGITISLPVVDIVMEPVQA